MTFWQHRGGTSFRAQETLDLEAPSSLRARKGQKPGSFEEDPTSTWPETLKRQKTVEKDEKVQIILKSAPIENSKAKICHLPSSEGLREGGWWGDP